MGQRIHPPIVANMQRLVPLALDLLAVIVFAIAGRASHGLDPMGLFATAWPFLAATMVAWVALWALADDGYGIRAAVVVWLITLLGGMALRLLSADTAATAFVIVATLFLAGAFGGWRLIAHAVRRRRARTA